MLIRFTTNEEKIFDFSPLLDFPCYQPLKEKSVFDSVYVDFGVTVWNNGAIDIAPDHLYKQGLPYYPAKPSENSKYPLQGHG